MALGIGGKDTITSARLARRRSACQFRIGALPTTPRVSSIGPMYVARFARRRDRDDPTNRESNYRDMTALPVVLLTTVHLARTLSGNPFPELTKPEPAYAWTEERKW